MEKELHPLFFLSSIGFFYRKIYLLKFKIFRIIHMYNVYGDRNVL